REINVILGKAVRVLRETEPLEEGRNLLSHDQRGPSRAHLRFDRAATGPSPSNTVHRWLKARRRTIGEDDGTSRVRRHQFRFAYSRILARSGLPDMHRPPSSLFGTHGLLAL